MHRMGVDCRGLPFRQPRADEGQRTRFVGIGRLVEKKGFEYLIDAFAKSRARQSATLTLVGDGPLRDALVAASGGPTAHRVRVDDRLADAAGRSRPLGRQ